MESNKMSDCPMPEDVSNIVQKLKFISLVKNGQKINLGRKTFCDSSSYFDAVKRFIDGESKDKLTIHIKDLISETSNIILKYKGTDWEQIIKNELLKAKSGIENLSKTYIHHPDTHSTLNTCIENIGYLI